MKNNNVANILLIIEQYQQNSDWLNKFISGGQKNVVYSFFNSNRRSCVSILQSFKNLNKIIEQSEKNNKKIVQEKIKQHTVFFKETKLLIEKEEEYLISKEGKLFHANIENYKKWSESQMWAFSTLFIFSQFNDQDLQKGYNDMINTLSFFSKNWKKDMENFIILWGNFLKNDQINYKDLFFDRLFENDIALALLFCKESEDDISLLRLVEKNSLIEELKSYMSSDYQELGHILYYRFKDNQNYNIKTFFSEGLMFILSFYINQNKIIEDDSIMNIFGINIQELNYLKTLSSLNSFFDNRNSFFIKKIEPHNKNHILPQDDKKLNNNTKNKDSVIVLNKYARNKDLVTFIAQKSNYSCSIDKNHESFISKSSGEKYVEVHHLIPLSCKLLDLKDVKLDVTINLFALCSTCHKKIHLSIDSEKMVIIEKLYNMQKQEITNYLEKHNIDNDVIKDWQDLKLTIEVYKKIYNIK